MEPVPEIPRPHRIKYQQELKDLEQSVLGGIDLVIEQLDRVTEALRMPTEASFGRSSRRVRVQAPPR